jgi:thioredoxin
MRLEFLRAGREPGVNLETKEMVTDMANVMEFNTANFDSEVVGSDVPVLVDFWAPWCGPCKMIGPIIEELSGEFGDKVKIGKVNVDDNQELAGKFGIRGIPTVMLFKGGDVVNSFVGLRSKEDLAGALNDAL